MTEAYDPRTDPDADWLELALKDMTWAIKAKRQMVQRGLTRARKRCPHCCGMVRLRLVGPKNHVHARCETTYGCLWFIE